MRNIYAGWVVYFLPSQKIQTKQQSCLVMALRFLGPMSASKSTPWKINMEHNHGGLEDDFPFQLGDL